MTRPLFSWFLASVLSVLAIAIAAPVATATPKDWRDSELFRTLPSWCHLVDQDEGTTIPAYDFGDRLNGCKVGSPQKLIGAGGQELRLRSVVLITTSRSSPTFTVRVLLDVLRNDKEQLAVRIQAGALSCGTGCAVTTLSSDVQQIAQPYTGMAEFKFTATPAVGSRDIVRPEVRLPIAFDVGVVPLTDFVDLQGPPLRCDNALPDNLTTGCVFDKYAPTWTMEPNRYPQIAAHIKDAATIMRIGLPSTERPLHRTDQAQKKVNRSNACNPVKTISNTFSEEYAAKYPDQLSCDEYPFASTYEGGRGTLANGRLGTPYLNPYRAKVPQLRDNSLTSIAQLNNAQNSLHGSALNVFYVNNRVLPDYEGRIPPDGGGDAGDAFYVDPGNPPPYSAPFETSDLTCAVGGSAASAAAVRAVNAACTKSGNTSYTWGGGHGATPGLTYGFFDGKDPASINDGSVLGFDCSGFVRWAWWRATGSDFLNGSSQTQRNLLAGNSGQASPVTARDALVAGDVIFFGTPGKVHHVALYLGNNKIVEALQSGTKIKVSLLYSHDDFYEAYRPVVSGSPVPDNSGNAYLWGTDINVRAGTSTAAAKVGTLPGPGLINVECQSRGDLVTYGTGTSEYWSKVPSVGGWISNVFIRGGAVIDGIPACAGTTLPPPGGGGRFQTWATNVNVRAEARTTAAKVATLATPIGLDVVCQRQGDTVSDGGVTNNWWSKIASPAGYVSNVYIKGPAKLDGVPECAGSVPPTGSGYFQIWATNVNVRADATTSSALVGTVPGPAAVTVSCQKSGQLINDGGYTSGFWAKIDSPAGFVNNVYIKGAALLPGVPLC